MNIQGFSFKKLFLSLLFTPFFALNAFADVPHHEFPTASAAQTINGIELVGNFSTLGFGPGTFQNSPATPDRVLINNGMAYLNQSQACIGTTKLDGSPVLGGVLVLNVSDPQNVTIAGRLPWSVVNPLTNPQPQWIRTGSGHISLGKVRNRAILAVVMNGADCTPFFPNQPPGVIGIELWDVTNPAPAKAVQLSFTIVKDVNTILAAATPNGVTGYIIEFYTRANKDYMAVAVTGVTLGSFRIYDITDPTNPTLAGFWGPELIQFPSLTPTDLINASSTTNPTLNTLQNFVNTRSPFLPFGFDVRASFSSNKATFVKINAEGTRAYVASNNSGLVLLDISDPSNIKMISQAIDLEDAARTQAIGSNHVTMSGSEKTVIERASSNPFFIKFTINSDPSFFVPVTEANFTPRIARPPLNGIWSSNNLRYVGIACNNNSNPAAPVPPPTSANQVALVLRGICSFSNKAVNVQNAGYSGYIIINSFVSGEITTPQAATLNVVITIPSVAIPYYDGLKLIDPNLVTGLVVPTPGSGYVQPPNFPVLPTCQTGTSDPLALCGSVSTSAGFTINSGTLIFSDLRIWDYKDRSNPKLVGTIGSFCGNHPSDPACAVGNFAVGQPILGQNHNLYAGWGIEGLLKFDLKDPKNPVLVGQWKDLTSAFTSLNGGLLPNFNFIARDEKTGCIYVTDFAGLFIFADQNQEDGKTCVGIVDE